MNGIEDKYENLIVDFVTDESFIKALLYHINTPTSKNNIIGRDKLAKLFEAYMLEAFFAGFSDGKEEVNKAREYFKKRFAEVSTSEVQEVVPEDAIAWYESYAIYLAGIYSEAILQKTESIIQEALEQGLHRKDIIKLLQESEEFKNFSESRLQTITRTEGTKAYNNGRVEQYRSSGGFVQAVQYSAILDRRTTHLCKRLNGKIIPLEDKSLIGMYTPPNHFNCRSILVPVTRYDDWTASDFSNIEKPMSGFDNPQWNPNMKK